MAHAKKEDAFYTLFKQFADELEATAVDYDEVMSGYPDTFSRIPQMKIHESKCDEIVKAIMEELYSAFVTPFDREDISALALALDDIVDSMYSVILRLDLFNIDDLRREAPQMTGVTLAAAREIREMLYLLPNYKKDPECMRHAMSVGRIEDEGSMIYHQSLSRLFHDEESGRMTVAWLRLFDRMVLALNDCDRAAGVVRNIVMKSA